MNEWFKVVGLGIFIIGIVVILDKYLGVTGHVVAGNFNGNTGSIVGVAAVFLGIVLMNLKRRKNN